MKIMRDGVDVGSLQRSAGGPVDDKWIDDLVVPEPTANDDLLHHYRIDSFLSYLNSQLRVDDTVERDLVETALRAVVALSDYRRGRPEVAAVGAVEE